MAQSQMIPSDWVAITPSDTTVLSIIGFFVGGAGTVAATTIKGTAVSFTCQAGQTIMGDFVKIASTGTTATLIVGAKP